MSGAEKSITPGTVIAVPTLSSNLIKSPFSKRPILDVGPSTNTVSPVPSGLIDKPDNCLLSAGKISAIGFLYVGVIYSIMLSIIRGASKFIILVCSSLTISSLVQTTTFSTVFAFCNVK